VVFCGLFPVDADDYADLRDALEKLSLNDASLRWEPETSQALGFGFRCGFLGLLHMDIVRERLEREYDLELLATTPNVEYRVTTTGGEVTAVRSPVELPPTTSIETIEEPYVRATILVPQDGVGAVMGLCQDRRGVFVTMEPIENRQQVVYDQYRGVVAFVRVVDGAFDERDKLVAMQTGLVVEAEQIGVMSPVMTPTGRLAAGETGYLVTGLKSLGDLRVGDTLTRSLRPAAEPLPGYREVKPMVFCGLFPVDADDYSDLRDALEKLSLNDASLRWEPETSQALGFGFRCGFLGLLHMDIVRERLEREYDLELLATTPNVEYRVTTTGGEVLSVRSPVELPPTTSIEKIEEPYVRCTILVPQDGVGAVMGLCQDRRGVFVTMEPIENRQQVVYDLPLAEIVLDFYDQLKSRTRGYASLDYEIVGYRESPLVKLDILLAGDQVDALSMIVHRDQAYARGKTLVERLFRTIPRQLFEVPIQAAIGGKILARETVKARRKDVLAKCYGGDISRKRKLLERQKEGKKRMKQVGAVEVPQEAFLSVLQIGDEGRNGK
jgi:GTP-binding protein LepA